MFLAVFEIPLPSGMIRCCSCDCSDSMVALVVQSAQNVGMVLGVLRVLGDCPPSGVY